MKINTERSQLADALAWVAQAIPRNPSHPTLAGVHLDATSDGLTVAGTDWTTSHTTHVPADVAEIGTAVVSGRYLRDVVAAIRDTHIDVAIDDRQLVISGKRATYRTSLMPIEDYPRRPKHPEAAGAVDHGVLAAAVAAVRPAVDDDPPSIEVAALAGIRFETSDHGLELAATDRFFLVRAAVDWDGADIAATVPGKAVEAAIKGMAGPIALGHDGHVFGIDDGTRRVTTRLIDATFPARWRELIRPADQDDFEFTADTAEMRDALVRTGRLVEGHEPVRIVITGDEIEIAVESSARSVGSGTDYVPVAATGAGEYLHLPSRLAYALAAMPTDQVRVGVATAAGKPFIVRPIGNDDRAAVVVPIRKR